MSGSELGSADLRVAKNKEVVRDIRVRVLTGLQLHISNHLPMRSTATGSAHRRLYGGGGIHGGGSNAGVYTASAAFQSLFTSKYQVRGALITNLVVG